MTALNDAVVLALLPLSGVLGGAAATLYGHWSNARNNKVTATNSTVTTRVTVQKTEQEVEIRWHDEWKKQCAENLTMSEQLTALTMRLEAVEVEQSRTNGLLTDCQKERLDLSKLVTHLASDRDRWRDAAKSYAYLDEMRRLGREDEALKTQAKARIEEAFQGEKLPEAAMEGAIA